MPSNLERMLTGDLTPTEQALACKALAYFKASVDPIDQHIAPTLFTRSKTAPRGDRRYLVSRGVVTPWQARAYARHMMERTFFDQLAAYRFMYTTCDHYVTYLGTVASYAPYKDCITEQDRQWFQELKEGFRWLVWKHDRKHQIAVAVYTTCHERIRVSGP